MSTPKLKDFPLRSLARITLQLRSPLHVGTGRGEAGSDAGFVRDANGLPFIPGSSIAGKIRRLTGCQIRDTKSAFGFQDRDKGEGSRLIVSNAVIHDASDTPRDGIVPEKDLTTDPILRSALIPRWRDHVRLSEQGAAADQGKFDDLSVAAGHRFSFEVEFIHAKTQEDGEFWTSLLAALRSPLFRLGGKTRRGFGGVEIVRIRQSRLDLSQREDFAIYRDHPASLSEPGTWQRSEDDPSSRTSASACKGESSTLQDLSLTLAPDSFWIFGGGTDAQADAAPVRDERIVWENNKPQVQTRWFVPFSSIKGALSHRTLYHARAAAGAWEPCPPDQLSSEETAALAAHRAIYGDVKTKDPSTRDQPGRLYGDDVWLGPAEEDLPHEVLQHHVAIDRLTGGALDSALFSDKPLWRDRETGPQTLRIPLFIDPPTKPDTAFTDGLAALRKALEDLRAGRLALGGLSGRGYGRFQHDPYAKWMPHILADIGTTHSPIIE